MAARATRWVGFAALALLLYAILMCVVAPARYFALVAGFVSRGAVKIDQTNGSFWDGNGSLTLAPDTKPLGKLHWKLYPAHLLRAALVADWRLEGPQANVTARSDVGWHRYTLRNVNVTAPVASVAHFYPPAALFGLSGYVQVNSPMFELADKGLGGEATLLFNRAASQMLPVNPLGDYRLLVIGRGKRAVLELNTLSGTLQLTGEGEWRALEDGSARMEGTIVANPPQPALEPMLNYLGPPHADGKRRFKIEQRLGPIDPANVFP